MSALEYKGKHYTWVMNFGFAAIALGIGLSAFGITSPLWLLLSLIVLVVLETLNSAGFHRLFCHRSYKTSRFWEVFLLTAGSIIGFGSSIQWFITHSIHHMFSDTEKDPYRIARFRDVFIPQKFTRNFKCPLSIHRRFESELKDPAHQFFHRYYWLFPFAVITVLGLLSPVVLLYGYLIPCAGMVLSGRLFTYLAHLNDKPSNKSWWLLFASGEWRHGAHHDDPGRWDLRDKWYHLDLAAIFISLIKKDDDGHRPTYAR